MRTLIVISGIVLLAGCGGSTKSTAQPAGKIAGMCLRGVIYKDTMYIGGATKVAPTPGHSLGTATVPPCNDVVDPQGQTDAKGEDVGVSAVEGVSPDVAIVRDGEEDTVYVRQDLMGQEHLPADVDRLING